MSTTHLTETSFSSLPLPPLLQQGVAAAGFIHCTPIQAKTLPLLLAGQDVAGQAQTGTGKTAAFLVALFNQLLSHPPQPRRQPQQPRALVLAPTRELAIQIHKDALSIGGDLGLTFCLAYGGAGYEAQRNAIHAGCDILIGTPGRLIDYLKQRVYDLKAVQAVVLDEADRMFDLGFINDVRYMFKRMSPPTQRLNMLFSATLSLRVTELAYEHMNLPQLVRLEEEQVTADRVRQSVYYPAREEKIPLLIGLLRQINPTRAILFTNTRRAGEQVDAWLRGNGYRSAILSGDVPQNRRQRLLGEFANGEFSLLVATDVAARGLHIPDVTHVFNFDLPQDPEDYVHRIGRTARAGAEGEAIAFACEDYAFSLTDIESYIGQRIPMAAITTELLAEPSPPQRDPNQQRVSHPQRRSSHGGGRSGGRGPRSR
jgi:ATP-dependent RNA helicase RhlB